MNAPHRCAYIYPVSTTGVCGQLTAWCGRYPWACASWTGHCGSARPIRR